jgi:hypothetical protein
MLVLTIPFFAKTYFANAAPGPSSGEYLRVLSRGKDIWDWPSGRSLCRCTDIMFFQNPLYRASRQLLVPRIAAVGTSFSPLPCQAWHGYGVTNAHHVDHLPLVVDRNGAVGTHGGDENACPSYGGDICDMGEKCWPYWLGPHNDHRI